MASRPYFKHDIEKIEALVRASSRDLKVLTEVRHELKFRSRPKARALAANVEELISKLSTKSDTLSLEAQAGVSLAARQVSAPQTLTPSRSPADRLAVECPKCKTLNFVSTLDGVVQHLSCSNCKVPYEARFLYGVMRTTFQVDHTKSESLSLKWIGIAFTFLVVLVLIMK